MKEKVIRSIQEVFSNYPSIKECKLYGSRAIGSHRYNSDIDLTLIGEEISFAELLTIENELDDLLLPYQIDLSIYHKIENENLIDHINRVGLTFYKKSEQIEFKES